jgi:hypothetical protein
MEAVYPDPFVSEPIPNRSDIGALGDELERQAALLTAAATGGARIETVRPAHRPPPNAKENASQRQSLGVSGGWFACLRF